MPPRDYEQELLDYLAQQFPATIGHLPLRRMIHSVWQQGMNSAAEICENHPIILTQSHNSDPAGLIRNDLKICATAQ